MNYQGTEGWPPQTHLKLLNMCHPLIQARDTVVQCFPIYVFLQCLYAYTCSFLRHCTLFFFSCFGSRVSHWFGSCQNRLSQSASKCQGSACLYLPGAGLGELHTIMPGLFRWVLVLKLISPYLEGKHQRAISQSCHLSVCQDRPTLTQHDGPLLHSTHQMTPSSESQQRSLSTFLLPRHWLGTLLMASHRLDPTVLCTDHMWGTEMHVSSCVWREMAIRCAMTLRTNTIWKHVTWSEMLICYMACTLKHSLGEILFGSVGWRLDGQQGSHLVPTSPWGRLELTSAGGS